MKHDELRLMRDICFKATLIGFGFLLLTGVPMMLWQEPYLNLIMSQWGLSDSGAVLFLMLGWFGLAKLFVIFGFFIPGLAIHWVLKKQEGASSPSA